MTNGVCTWQTLGADPAGVLLLVNSAPGDVANMASLCDELERIGGRLCAVVPPVWRDWFIARGWPDGQLLSAAAPGGGDLELNYFLESPPALQWMLEQRCPIVIGSAPHNLYNEEIKSTFERRVALILGGGRFLAHTLPHPYVYNLTLADLLHRMGRAARIAGYRRDCDGLIRDLYARWQERGSPHADDQEPFDEVAALLLRRVSAAAAPDGDEAGISVGAADAAPAIAEFVAYAESVFHPVLVDQAAAVGALQRSGHWYAQEIERRDRILADQATERIEAVNIRDRRIDELHHELDDMTKGWRRFVVRRK